MATLRGKNPPIREKRVGAISAWSGTLGGLATESVKGDLDQRIRTYAQDAPSDVEHALQLLSTIEGLAIVVHGPAGCSAALRDGGTAREAWVTTNLDERDSIMGSDAKLRRAILELHRSASPRAIAVVATPVVAINNDDIDSVVEDLSEEIGIPLFAVYTDGFRSKIGSSGQDAAVHALLKLVPAGSEPRPASTGRVVLLSVSETLQEVDEFRRILEALGLEVVSFPRHSSVDDFAGLAHADLAVALDTDAADYAGSVLRDIHGVKFLDAGVPVGLEGVSHWIRVVARELDVAEKAEALLEAEKARIAPVLSQAAKLRGARVFANLPPAQALAFPVLARNLGLELAGLKTTWIAAHHGRRASLFLGDWAEVPLLVGEGQLFEEANQFSKRRPDLYVSSSVSPVHALRSGIPSIDLAGGSILGFEGLVRFVRSATRVLENPSLSRFLADAGNEPYERGWLSKSVHWYIKQEVK